MYSPLMHIIYILIHCNIFNSYHLYEKALLPSAQVFIQKALHLVLYLTVFNMLIFVE